MRLVPRRSSDPPAGDDIEVLQIQPNFYVIAGAGGNIGVQIGQDGVVVVDTGTAAKSDQVLAQIQKLTKQPIRYIINTNADPDHVGGNEKLSAAGQSVIPTGGLNDIASAGGRAVIFAEEHVLSRMSAPTGKQAAYPSGAWPTSSYSSALGEKQKDVYLNGEAIQVFAQPAAHTDGDSVVFFRRSDVLVVGDVLDTTRFPVIDLEKGGSVQGVIDSLNRIIVLAVAPTPLVWQEGGTIVVPGPRPDLRQVRRRRLPRHGDDRPRRGAGHDQEGDDARADPEGQSDAGLPQAIRRRLRLLDDGHVRRGGLQEPSTSRCRSDGLAQRHGVT